jgi:hypothetical protein
MCDPSYPQLTAHAPVLRRAPGEWQIGLEPDEALVLRGPEFGPVLELLDGAHPFEEIRRQARRSGLGERQLRTTVAALTAIGLLTDRGASPPKAGHLAEARVRLIGAGPVGWQIATVLDSAAVAELHIFDDAAPENGLYPSAGAHGTRAQAACSTLPAWPPRVRSPLSHWSKPDAHSIDLTIIATETPEVDRVLTDHFVRHDQPHLLVRGLGRGVTVGPLVIPGRTSCVRCADLRRSDADPSWPNVLTQLTQHPLPLGPALVSWAAQTAAIQALAYLAGSTPESCGSTLELSERDYVMRWRSWPAHVGCGCGWIAPTEWGS